MQKGYLKIEQIYRAFKGGRTWQFYKSSRRIRLYTAGHEPDDFFAGEGTVHQIAIPLQVWDPSHAGGGAALPLYPEDGFHVSGDAGNRR